MTSSPLETALRRDRLIVAIALATLTMLAWIYLLWLARVMAAMNMDMSTMPAAMDMSTDAVSVWLSPRQRIATPLEFVVLFLMWAVMMVGMMTPSVAPMILLYARVGRQAATQNKPLAATGYFAAGYLLSWLLFSLAATVLQVLLARWLLLTPMMVSNSEHLSGVVLIAAGLFQWTAVKEACLRQCQAPLQFIQRHGGFRRERLGSLRVGFRHSLYCIGCCWMLMVLLFVGGVMNLLWIAAISIFILAEKILPATRWLSRAAGAVFCAGGIYLLAFSRY